MRKQCPTPWLIVLLLPALSATCLQADSTSGTSLSMSQPLAFDEELVPMRLHIETNRVVNAHNQHVALRGVNIPSLEYTSEGEHVQESVRRAIQEWKANLIRLPLAQDRWFGMIRGMTNGPTAYRALVDTLVRDCASAKTYLILELHWSDCGKWEINGGKVAQHSMPDQYSVDFWRDVATRYRNHPHVIFGLYNEPHDVSWEIWRDGGTVTETPPQRARDSQRTTYEAAGMQKLYDTVRAAGAENVVTVSGLDWGYDLSGLLKGYALKGYNILYETHPYPQKKRWDEKFGAICNHYAVYVGEWGGGPRDEEYFRTLMAYIEQRNLPWTAWSFHPACRPCLIKNWDYQPTAFGEFVKNALAQPVQQPNSGTAINP